MTNQFRFQPRWKEELVVSGSDGSFVLELPMGALSAYLPSEKEWSSRAPEWARALWPELKRELEHWCSENGATLHIDPAASIQPI